jgi:dimethylglycine dehydrogenase
VAPIDVPGFSRSNWWRHVGNECLSLAHALGLVEMSSYAKFVVEGPGAREFLDYVGSARVRDTDGRVSLSLLLNDRGGIIGDMTVCRLGADRYYVIGPTLGEGIYRRWFDQHAVGRQVSVRTVTADRAVLGVMGPQSRALLQSLSADDFSSTGFPFMTTREVSIGPARCLAMRLSYAGELGWELHCSMDALTVLYGTLVDAGKGFGLTLVGSRAMGQLRLEKGYRSWGAELTPEVPPRAAGLERFCSSQKYYVGRPAVDAARSADPGNCLATVVVDTEDTDCWGSEPIYHNGGLIGYVTSGGYGWRAGRSLAIGWIPFDTAVPGTMLEVEILGVRRNASVVADPVYDPDNSRLFS